MPAARTQGPEAELDVAPGERVQHHVDAFAPGRRHQPVVPVEAVRIERGPYPQLQQPFPPGLAAGGGVDLRSRMPGQSDGRLPDAAHGGVDQNALTAAQSGQVHERVVRGDVDRQRRCGLLHAQAFGPREHEVLVHQDAVGDAPALQEGHLVADPAMAHVRPDAAHHATGLHADLVTQRRALVGKCRQQPQRDHHVAEVERRRRHVDLHVVRTRRRELVRLHLQPGDLARVVEGEAVRRLRAGGHPRVTLPDADQSRRPQAPLPNRQLAVAQVAAGQPGERLQIPDITQIDQAKIEHGFLTDFDGHAPDRPPQCAPARILHVVNGPARHHGQAAPTARVLDPVGNQGLDEGNETRRHGFSRGIVRTRAAEEIDCLQLGRARPFAE